MHDCIYYLRFLTSGFKKNASYLVHFMTLMYLVQCFPTGGPWARNRWSAEQLTDVIYKYFYINMKSTVTFHVEHFCHHIFIVVSRIYANMLS